MQPDFDALQPGPTGEEPPSVIVVAAPRKKGWTALAWLVIVGLSGFFVLAQSKAQQEAAKGAEQESLKITVFEIQARYLVGGARFFPEEGPEFFKQAKLLNEGPFAQRLRFAIIAGELGGPAEAREVLKALVGAPREADERVHDILSRLYDDYSAGLWNSPSVSAEEKAKLVAELGWFGELALHPLVRDNPPAGVGAVAGAPAAVVIENQAPDPAARAETLDDAKVTFATIIILVGAGLFIGMGGFIGLIIFLSLLASRKLRGGLTTGASYGGVYAETFALWLALFAGLHVVSALAPHDFDLLAREALVFLGSLTALTWPLCRGIPFAQFRQDVGLTLGRRPALEPLIGLACYAMSLPLLVVGLILTLLLTAAHHALTGGLADLETPIHPVVNIVAHGDLFTRMVAVVLACILAPLIEETMFRGVLYRHLREVSGRWAWIWSVVFSGTVTSFLFAALHPQGLLAAPALMALAYGFTIAREWRQSLVAPMVGHALNNGVLMLFLMLVLGR